MFKFTGAKIAVFVENSQVRCKTNAFDVSVSRWLRLKRFFTSSACGAPSTLWLNNYFINHVQNGSLLEAFEMWISAASGLKYRKEKCYICFCTRHIMTGTLPAVCCHQCLNLFHEICKI